jgi:hypothetical protein
LPAGKRIRQDCDTFLHPPHGYVETHDEKTSGIFFYAVLN